MTVDNMAVDQKFGLHCVEDGSIDIPQIHHAGRNRGHLKTGFPLCNGT